VLNYVVKRIGSEGKAVGRRASHKEGVRRHLKRLAHVHQKGRLAAKDAAKEHAQSRKNGRFRGAEVHAE